MDLFVESKIFKNEYILSSEYLPPLLPHREGEIKQLARNLLPASKGRKPQNTFLYGPPGIGKTASVRYVFREFEDYSGIKSTYINCWDYKTAVAVLAKITTDLGYPVQRHGWSKDEIISRLIEVLSKLKKGLIVCLDEVDQLIFKDESALYNLLRINQYVKNPIGLVFVSNEPYVFANVEPRIKSSLDIEEIEFRPYSLLEMKDILEERVKLAFYRFEPGVVILAANRAIKKGGDVRVGLQCLLKAGRLAEEENCNKVKVEHIKAVLRKIGKVKPNIIKEKINEHERIILDILKKSGKLYSGELYKKYREKTEKPKTNRMFRSYLEHLKQLKMIKVRRKHGNIRIISPA